MAGRPEIIKTAIGKRLRELRGSDNRSQFADKIDSNKSTYGNYERGDRSPDLDFLKSISKSIGVNLNWLALGIGPKELGATEIVPPNDSPELQPPPPAVRQAPIAGMASCGPDGWSRLTTTQFQAELPKSLQSDKDAFAVISRGESMQPFGIYEGYLCFCSPATKLLIGDIVCIERKGEDDKISLTIKKLGIISHGAYEIIGYRPTQEIPSLALHGKEYQELFWEAVNVKDVERISVVTHIYTRPSAY